MEQSTKENEAVVSRIYEETLGFDGDLSRMTTTQQVVYLVEHMMQEVNSGISFEQYFRWATIDEIDRIVPTLQQLGLNDLAGIVQSAIGVAFPGGVPRTEEEKHDHTEWTGEQEQSLKGLFQQVEELNGRVMNVLGAFASTSETT